MKKVTAVLALLLLSISCSEKSTPSSAILVSSEEASSLSTTMAFQHGVASGDPLSNAVILWTRVSPHATEKHFVLWEVFEDLACTISIKKGEEDCTATKDFTVKVDVQGLEPNTIYYYRFSYNDQQSPIGTTRTAPLPSNTEPVRLAFGSCSNYEAGYFTAYKALSEEKGIQAFVHLGDYIYEYGEGVYGNKSIARTHEPANELISLSDYRKRYSQYRRDLHLQAAHQSMPFICIWDDHEIANNTWAGGAQNHQPEEGDWEQRRAAARQAYNEWMPVRVNAEGDHYRKLQFGATVDLWMLDTRLAGRTEQVESSSASDYNSDKRKILGDKQMNWLTTGLQTSQATWKIVGNSVPFGPITIHWKDTPDVYMDGWDGYPAERNMFANFLLEKAVKNVVFLTGDFHSSVLLETDIHRTPLATDNSAVEIIVPSITSANQDERFKPAKVKALETFYREQNAHLKYVNLRDHGYVVVDCDDGSMRGNFVFVESLTEMNNWKTNRIPFSIPLNQSSLYVD